VPALSSSVPYPRSRLTLSEIVTRVKRDLSLDGSNLLSTADITEWLNQAQEIFARETLWFTYALSLSTVINQAEYAFPDAAAAQVLTVEWVRLDDQDLTPMRSQGRLDFSAFDWRDQTGRPTHWWLRGMNAIRLWPTPSTASSNGLDVYGRGLPPVVLEAGDQFYIPNGFDDALQNYAKMMATRKDAHGEGARRAGLYERDWEMALEKGKRAVAQSDEWEEVGLGRDALRGASSGYRLIPPFTNLSSPL